LNLALFGVLFETVERKERDTFRLGNVDARRDEATLRSEEENARKGGRKKATASAEDAKG